MDACLAAAEAINGIIKELIEQPRKAIVVSYAIGALNGAIGATLYLKNKVWIGGLLIALGIITPLLPWWILILRWSTAQ